MQLDVKKSVCNILTSRGLLKKIRAVKTVFVVQKNLPLLCRFFPISKEIDV
jgi:hypothetical protein